MNRAPQRLSQPRAPAATGRGRTSAVLAALVAAGLMAGCMTPLLLGGAMVGTALAVADRRTTGIQVEDQGIELKALQRLGGLGEGARASATSFNRVVLLTGEVPSEAARGQAEQAVRGIENVRNVVNELAVGAPSSLTTRASDSSITSRVKAALVKDEAVHANTVKVVTERGVVYLMGLVTEGEAAAAVERARAVGSVLKVVKVFEIVGSEEAARLSAGSPPRR